MLFLSYLNEEVHISQRDRIEGSSFYTTSRPKGVLSKLNPQGSSLPLSGWGWGWGGARERIITCPSLPLSNLSWPQCLAPGSPGLLLLLSSRITFSFLLGHFILIVSVATSLTWALLPFFPQPFSGSNMSFLVSINQVLTFWWFWGVDHCLYVPISKIIAPGETFLFSYLHN